MKFNNRKLSRADVLVCVAFITVVLSVAKLSILHNVQFQNWDYWCFAVSSISKCTSIHLSLINWFHPSSIVNVVYLSIIIELRSTQISTIKSFNLHIYVPMMDYIQKGRILRLQDLPHLLIFFPSARAPLCQSNFLFWEGEKGIPLKFQSAGPNNLLKDWFSLNLCGIMLKAAYNLSCQLDNLPSSIVT